MKFMDGDFTGMLSHWHMADNLDTNNWEVRC